MPSPHPLRPPLPSRGATQLPNLSSGDSGRYDREETGSDLHGSEANGGYSCSLEISLPLEVGRWSASEHAASRGGGMFLFYFILRARVCVSEFDEHTVLIYIIYLNNEILKMKFKYMNINISYHGYR